MKASQNPFRINIGFLINQPIGYSRDIPFDLEGIELGENLCLHSLTGNLTLIRNQDGFRSQAVFDGVVDNECGRCLDRFAEKIHSEFEEYFTFPFTETSDDEIQVPEDGNVDFAPIMYDYLLIEMPINPVCRDDCKGLCDVCGANLNKTTCKHVYKSREIENSKTETGLESKEKPI